MELDRESPDAMNGAFILEVSATEGEGEPGQTITSEITIIIEVVTFKGTLCKISIFYGEVNGTTMNQKIVL